MIVFAIPFPGDFLVLSPMPVADRFGPCSTAFVCWHAYRNFKSWTNSVNLAEYVGGLSAFAEVSDRQALTVLFGCHAVACCSKLRFLRLTGIAACMCIYWVDLAMCHLLVHMNTMKLCTSNSNIATLSNSECDDVAVMWPSAWWHVARMVFGHFNLSCVQRQRSKAEEICSSGF